LMIMSREMQHAMQDKNLDLVIYGMFISARVIYRNLSRDGNVARVSGDLCIWCRERENICCFIFPAKAAIQRLQLLIRSDQNGDCATQFGCAARAIRKGKQLARLQGAMAKVDL